MQGSSGGTSSLLYSTAVTVRFFDAVALALFAPDLRGWRFGILLSARDAGTPWRYRPFSGSDFRLADKTAVQFFVALRGR